ncbi:MAG: hyperosmotically inducible periplasmic protein [Bryobacterales bacterium]|jgi:osmotically-inducible protein OsmY|nr:hyperosmotically inducible periplasmic protein [Bryobacterales bacterium]
MINKRLGLSLVLFLSLLLTVQAATKPVTDDFISDTVRQKLAADSLVKGGAIDVEVKDGTVTLKGKVQEPKQKDKAERIAKKVNGVKTVVNEIKIEKP